MSNLLHLPGIRAPYSDVPSLAAVESASRIPRPSAKKCAGYVWRPKRGVYLRANQVFSPARCQATSYGWWLFVDRIGDRVVFNSYRYSTTTSKHQSQMRQLLRELGIAIDVEIEAPKGLQDLAAAELYHTRRSEECITDSEAPRLRAATREAKRAEALQHQQCAAEVRELLRLRSLSNSARAARGEV